MDRHVKESSGRSYVATAAFNTNFFKYTTTFNSTTFETTGAFTAVTGATAGNCPAGRILRETGKKLYPGANPGVSTLMVGVFDNQSMLNGFIDPNSPLFAVYSTDRPSYMKDAVDPVGGLTDHGPPVYTNGSADILGYLNVTGNSALTGNLQVTGNVTANGRLILNSGNTGIVNLTSGTVFGSYRKLTVNASNCRVGSIIMLTYTGLNSPGILSTEYISNGSFQIVSTSTTDAGVVMYMIIN